MAFPTHRPRRLRATPALRRLVAETDPAPAPARAADVREGGRRRAGADRVDARRRPAHPRLAAQGRRRGRRRRGSAGSCCSACPPAATPPAAAGVDPDGVLNVALRDVRAEVGDATVVMADTCLDEFTDHGHCGVLDDDGGVDNDATLAVYARDGRGAGRRGRAPAGPERDDGRPGRRDPGRARRRGAPRHRDPRLHRQVRLGVLRAVPRGRREPAARRPQDLPAGRRQRPRVAARARARPGRGRRHGDGQARDGLPRRAARRRRGLGRAGRGLPGVGRVRDGRGGGGERLAGPRPHDPGDADRDPPRRRGRRAHLLGDRGRRPAWTAD